MSDMAGKVAQEHAAGRTASSDLLLGTETHFGPLLHRDVLEEYDYTLLSPRVGREVLAAKNIGVEIRTPLAGIAYHAERIPAAEAPRRLEDVLQPKWKGLVASTQNAAYFDRVAYRPEWGPEKLKSFVVRLSEHVGGLVRASESARVVSGEFLMLVMGSSDTAYAEQARGAPLGFVVPEDAVVLTVNYLGVPRNSAHPNLSKLFVNMVLSEEGQQLVYETTFADHYALPGSRAAARVRDLRAQGVEPLKIDVQFHLDHPEIADYGRELERILREQGRG
jgi:ABC-type Fe3+ transport system substrate-binding protein